MAVTVPFPSVLVANRGEIACRIIRTLRRLGIRSVAVYSDADRDAPHVALADLAVRIGPAPARDSYLDVDAIVAAAVASGARAIHPGYGFLSEKAALAAACEAAGVVFVGPGVRAIEIMGDKIAAKRQVEARGVPTIPGLAEPGLSDEAIIAASDRIGYPVLVKPSAGGGGKGMQAVRAAADLPDALRAARRIAASAFGDDTLFLERLVDAPRHIEVQILADGHGSLVHLGERECSLQRRHQKVIEESPSPLLDPETRHRIGAAACRVAAAVDYVGAGTVEFLVSAEAPDEFFFMEMNTRLQVEHPVTELVTGVDLVEWQLRIAAGEPLGFAQADVRLDGHAMEARVYAEDPDRGFLPSGGTVLALREPRGEGVRVDSGLAPGLSVVTEYDPLLSKVIAWGEDRPAALARLDAALADTSILGVTTNVAWLRRLLADPEVVAGAMDTTLIDRRHSEVAASAASTTETALAALLGHRERMAAAPPQGVGALWAAPSGWRMTDARPVRYDVDGTTVTVSGDGARVVVAGTEHTVALEMRDGASGEPDRALLTFDDATTGFDTAVDGASVWLASEGRVRACRLVGREERLAVQRAALDRGGAALQPALRSPMPGTVVALPVVDGDPVTAGDTVAVVEAMKMEHRLVAPIAGTLRLHIAIGDLVRLEQLVASIDADPQHPPAPADSEDPTPSTVAATPQGQSPRQTGTP
jgi:acetyl-CoA/propionyl-CoA carboxylase biotin carboxyl carrier protein